MLKKYFTLSLAALVLLFSSCAAPPAIPFVTAAVTSLPALSQSPYASDSPASADTLSPADVTDDDETLDPEEINSYWNKALTSGWKIADTDPRFSSSSLPSLPVLSKEDRKKFNKDKLAVYLIGAAQQRYIIDNAEIKNGTLYLTIEDDLYANNVNTVYQYLKNEFYLSDNEIRSLSDFEDCVIRDNYMYADEDAWKDRRQYASEEDWEDSSEDDVNYADLDYIDLDPLPVAPDAKIYLVAADDWFDISPQQLIAYLKSEPGLLDYLNYMDIAYNNGLITEIVEEYCP